MDPVSMAQNVIVVCKMIQQQAETAKNNIAQCKRLSSRIQTIQGSIEKLIPKIPKAVPGGPAGKVIQSPYQMPLQALLDTLQHFP